MCKSPECATVNTTSAQIVAQNFHRVGAFIRNMDAAKTVYLAFGHDAEVGKGVALLPREAFQMSREDYSTEAIHAIASGDTTAVSIQEFDLTAGD